MRLIQAAVTVFLVATLTFLAVHLAPGDPLQVLQDSPRVAANDVAQLRRLYHLDQPVWTQYAYYVVQLAHLDLGYSFGQHRPVLDALVEALPATVELALAAICVMFGLGVGIGAYQGAHANSPLDRMFSAGALVLWAAPSFWLALLLIVVFVERLHLLPAVGAVDVGVYDSLGLFAQVLDRLRHLVLPGLTLGLIGAGYLSRYQRTAMRAALSQPFVRAARARGLTNATVLLRHALRNALLPAVAIFGVELPSLLSGAVIVEPVFGWPGMGRLAAGAIFQRDYPLVTGAAILAATVVVAGTLVADLLAHLVDPRLRTPA
jgi:peptide/nickel transport system permease protein